MSLKPISVIKAMISIGNVFISIASDTNRIYKQQQAIRLGLQVTKLIDFGSF